MLASVCWRGHVHTGLRTALLFRPVQYTNPHRIRSLTIMAATKRKRASVDASKVNGGMPPTLKRRASTRNSIAAASVNPDINKDVVDAPNATRASPDGDINGEVVSGPVKQEIGMRIESPLSDVPAHVEPPVKQARGRKSKAAKAVKDAETAVKAVVDAAATNGSGTKKGRGKAQIKQENGEVEAMKAPTTSSTTKGKAKKNEDEEARDPEAEGEEEAGEEEVTVALSRPPPVNSDYLPLPWKGRLGYACLNTYLRNSNPPVFSLRTCRIQSILEHRHPLRDPTEPEHSSKNRPDPSKPVDIELGMRYVEALCLANVKDIAKMVRWNDKYGIRFFRLSSEMFPFASHPEYGYKLAPFASEALAEAGKVVAELGHRVTTHPGQFTQLGSPRKPVIDNAYRDLEYHDQMLSLLKLPEQQDRDAVMILHMGGIFEGKQETLRRFRENYPKLSQSVKNRLVLENDDMGWSVHDLLPICEELDIPLVLDFHHHNIVFDPTQIREGTKDIMDLYPRIKATWDRKGIKQKMHYSEPTPAAITPKQRRKHSPRVANLPPCAPDMDLMIEAKDKEQAVFELMRTFKLPGYDTFYDILPYTRNDDNKVAFAEIAKKSRKMKTKKDGEDADEPESVLVVDDDVGMGGPEGRVYWPPGMEEWLRPKKREVKKKEPAQKDAARSKKEAADAYAAREAEKEMAESRANGVGEEEASDFDATPATKKARATMWKKQQAGAAKESANGEANMAKPAKQTGKKAKPKKAAPMPSPPTDMESEGLELDDEDGKEPVTSATKRRSVGSRKASGRVAKNKRVSYKEEEDDAEMEEA